VLCQSISSFTKNDRAILTIVAEEEGIFEFLHPHASFDSLRLEGGFYKYLHKSFLEGEFVSDRNLKNKFKTTDRFLTKEEMTCFRNSIDTYESSEWTIDQSIFSDAEVTKDWRPREGKFCRITKPIYSCDSKKALVIVQYGIHSLGTYDLYTESGDSIFFLKKKCGKWKVHYIGSVYGRPDRDLLDK